MTTCCQEGSDYIFIYFLKVNVPRIVSEDPYKVRVNPIKTQILPQFPLHRFPADCLIIRVSSIQRYFTTAITSPFNCSQILNLLILDILYSYILIYLIIPLRSVRSVSLRAGIKDFYNLYYLTFILPYFSLPYLAHEPLY